MFNAKQIAEQRAEIKAAREGRLLKGCALSLFRRNYEALEMMLPAEKEQWLRLIGLNKAYRTEMASVLAEIKYGK